MSLSSIQLEAFLSVAQLGNFTKAADRLHITQSALSQRILNLETDLQTTLFVRQRGGTRLTEAGVKLLHYCQVKQGLEDELLQGLTSQGTSLGGVINIAAYSTVARSVILPAISSLIQTHNNLRLNLRTAEIGDLPSLLHSGEFDFIIMNSVVTREGLSHIELGEECSVLCEKIDYDGPDRYLDHNDADQTTFQYLKLLKRRPAEIKRQYLGDIYALIDGVKLGLGRAVIPQHLIREEKQIRALHKQTVLREKVYLTFHEAPYQTKLHQAIIQCLRAKCPRYLETT